MNREDIIRMAREAGAELAELPMMDAWLFAEDEYLERFAALVASAERERLTDAAMKSAEKAVDVAIALEREACAKVCDGVQDCGPENGCCPTYWNESLERAAAAIRARGKHD